ncbi:WD40 repeat domain-containing protein, partial [Singulisphaera rosea]
VKSGRPREEFPAKVGRLWSVAFAPDGRSLAVGGSEGIVVRALSSGNVRRWSCPKGVVTVVHYFPDGATLASCGLDGSVDLWDIARDRVLPRCSLSGQTCRVKAMAVSPDGTTIVSGGDDAKLRIWELAGHSTLASLTPAIR